LKEVIFVTGLPASGKTVFGSELAEELNYFLMDEPKYDSIREHSVNFNLVVICASFCLKKNRARIMKLLPNSIIKWIAFENDPTLCGENDKYRRNLIPNLSQADISKVSKLYTYPENCEIIPVWKRLTK